MHAGTGVSRARATTLGTKPGMASVLAEGAFPRSAVIAHVEPGCARGDGVCSGTHRGMLEFVSARPPAGPANTRVMRAVRDEFQDPLFTRSRCASV